MRVLSEFTRIFPPQEKIPGLEEINGGDDENDGKITILTILSYDTVMSWLWY